MSSNPPRRPVFVTTAEFLPQHHRQLEQTRALIAQAEQHGQERLAEMNRTVEKNLLTIITGLDTSHGSGDGCASSCRCAQKRQATGEVDDAS